MVHYPNSMYTEVSIVSSSKFMTFGHEDVLEREPEVSPGGEYLHIGAQPQYVFSPVVSTTPAGTRVTQDISRYKR